MKMLFIVYNDIIDEELLTTLEKGRCSGLHQVEGYQSGWD